MAGVELILIDCLWVLGYALVANNPWALIVPVALAAVGIIANEQAVNAIRQAFPGWAPRVFRVS